MKKLSGLVLVFTMVTFMPDVGNAEPTRYSFDVEDHKKNIKSYVLTKGSDGELGCWFLKMIFLKDIQVGKHEKTDAH